MNGFFGRRADRKKPFVQGRIQSSTGEAGTSVECLQHDTSNGFSIRAENYDRMFADFAVLSHCDRDIVVIDLCRRRKDNMAARIGMSHSELIKWQLRYKSSMDRFMPASVKPRP